MPAEGSTIFNLTNRFSHHLQYSKHRIPYNYVDDSSIPGPAQEYDKSASHLDLSGIGKSFHIDAGPLVVLEGIDMCVKNGEFASLIGPSGCGKSTLLNIIAGLEEPTDGIIRSPAHQSHLRLGSISYMHQKDLLLPWRTVLDNTILALEIQGQSKSQARKQALQLMDSFGLKGFEKSYPSLLSGGMRQRAAFLRTVLANRDIILLDEPFGALDSITRTSMQEWLLQLCMSWRKTVLMVTHDVEEAVLLSDSVYVLTSRPGHVKKVVQVNLPRPRKYDMVMQQDFIRIKSELMSSLREDAGWACNLDNRTFGISGTDT